MRNSNGERGYFAIGVFRPKTEQNIGTLWRHADLYGAAYVFTIGSRYRKQSSDTSHTPFKIPLLHYGDFEDFQEHAPYAAETVCVELADSAVELPSFSHPPQAIYLLGAEDHGLPRSILEGRRCVQIPSPGERSMNVAVAGSLVMYDRHLKGRRLGIRAA